ncbi:hypothetical protein TREMEDRAFT_65733 [Tremella mesenterica DSM 1558]|uniref:uncharacterized protein n=1 Tax=Tremella mesenterica (strain ATCC 24925 / CBS 8224 / DSM 1558 / NBRC 9311 / NRRL Y-6157 / RJB 2259-6 / UBC 559-6) TaxID=578456 RepID=UPI00032C5C88|nr:uncharacterized protein TREMEDRAFT_65733 [Tremella mesenterica DSM 1558]EIW66138.1 hypothetical protein TREMEDRAFT_65733 [Tremella mesenterica DSM 1558]
MTLREASFTPPARTEDVTPEISSHGDFELRPVENAGSDGGSPSDDSVEPMLPPYEKLAQQLKTADEQSDGDDEQSGEDDRQSIKTESSSVKLPLWEGDTGMDGTALDDEARSSARDECDQDPPSPLTPLSELEAIHPELRSNLSISDLPPLWTRPDDVKLTDPVCQTSLRTYQEQITALLQRTKASLLTGCLVQGNKYERGNEKHRKQPGWTASSKDLRTFVLAAERACVELTEGKLDDAQQRNAHAKHWKVVRKPSETIVSETELLVLKCALIAASSKQYEKITFATPRNVNLDSTKTDNDNKRALPPGWTAVSDIPALKVMIRRQMSRTTS